MLAGPVTSKSRKGDVIPAVPDRVYQDSNI